MVNATSREDFLVIQMLMSTVIICTVHARLLLKFGDIEIVLL